MYSACLCTNIISRSLRFPHNEKTWMLFVFSGLLFADTGAVFFALRQHIFKRVGNLAALEKREGEFCVAGGNITSGDEGEYDLPPI